MNDFQISDGVLEKYNGNEKNVVIPETVTKIMDEAANFGRPVRTFRNQRYAHSGLIGTSISDKRYAFLYTDHKAV